MVASAYILFTVTHGSARKVFDRLSSIPGVVRVNAISGPYDLIALLQGADFSAIGKIIIDKIQPIDGIERTITCNVIEFEQ
jgi:DNA-binding Lrp family transcriptional regulator